jgi:hypothetical protein
MVSDLPICNQIQTSFIDLDCTRAKPQNRTEVSPTTKECSTTELELPINVTFIRIKESAKSAID